MHRRLGDWEDILLSLSWGFFWVDLLVVNLHPFGGFSIEATAVPQNADNVHDSDCIIIISLKNDSNRSPSSVSSMH